MAAEVHIYNQAQSITDNEIDLYTVPMGKVFVGSVHWGETGGTTATVRLAIRIGGAVLAQQQYRVYDKQINPNSSENTLPLHLSADDVVTVRANGTNVNFHISGQEFTY